VKAGTAMPREGEVQLQAFHLYCTDPRDGVAKFQICAPARPGALVLPNEPRVHLENVSVRVDPKARPFRERLELDVRITDDLILEAHARSLSVGDEDRREVHNLEFGLAFPTAEPTGSSCDDDSETKQAEGTAPASRGALSIRANVADREDWRLVPGEHLYEFNPQYFDSRSSPPEEQVSERLYYEPCLSCKRASNDPLCRCSDGLPVRRQRPAVSGGNVAQS
jgi:molecular chaperone DnaK